MSIAFSSSFSPRKRAISSSYFFFSSNVLLSIDSDAFSFLNHGWKEHQNDTKKTIKFSTSRNGCSIIHWKWIKMRNNENYSSLPIGLFVLQHLHIFTGLRQNATLRLAFNCSYTQASTVANFRRTSIRWYNISQFHNPVIDFVSSPSFHFIVCRSSSIIALFKRTQRIDVWGLHTLNEYWKL